jgi:hypothetical protein
MSFNELVSQCERDDRESNASSTEFYRGINDEIDKSYKEIASNSEEEIDLRVSVFGDNVVVFVIHSSSNLSCCICAW